MNQPKTCRLLIAICFVLFVIPVSGHVETTHSKWNMPKSSNVYGSYVVTGSITSAFKSNTRSDSDHGNSKDVDNSLSKKIEDRVLLRMSHEFDTEVAARKSVSANDDETLSKTGLFDASKLEEIIKTRVLIRLGRQVDIDSDSNKTGSTLNHKISGQDAGLLHNDVDTASNSKDFDQSLIDKIERRVIIRLGRQMDGDIGKPASSTPAAAGITRPVVTGQVAAAAAAPTRKSSLSPAVSSASSSSSSTPTPSRWSRFPSTRTYKGVTQSTSSTSVTSNAAAAASTTFSKNQFSTTTSSKRSSSAAPTSPSKDSSSGDDRELAEKIEKKLLWRMPMAQSNAK